MRIATWNVNSLRSRIARVEDLLQRHDIDVLAVQETKAREDQLPLMGLQSLGYDIAAHGLDQWNGVAVISRVGISDIVVGFPDAPGWGEPAVQEARAIGALCGTGAAALRMWSLYVPNGRKPDDPHYHYKLQWLERLHAAAGDWLAAPTVLAGDWNIAPTDEDVFDITRFTKSTHVTPPEREAFARFLASGYVDLVRPHVHGADGYTYWDYYRQRFERNRGMRIDFLLGSPGVGARVRGAFVDREERGAQGTSDHAPVVVDLED
ncbi:MAG: exodeoxyribonuclease III [Marmoricola sp.]